FCACTPDNVTVDNSLQKYFDSAGVRGCFGLFDNGQGHFTIYNLPRFRDSSFQPAETFDIPQSLIALQTGILGDDKSLVALDSTASVPFTLRQAFQVRYRKDIFVQLTRRLGQDSLRRWVDSLHYGNKNLGGFPEFWYNDSLKITADEQLGLIKRLYFDQLPFFNRPQQLVRGIMPLESTTTYRLAYKTAQTGNRGWVMGWVEENNHPYFFVVNLESDSARDLPSIGLQIVKSILRPMGFFEGKK
ncbi:MAG TPA: penicillin-binding transpeptidase domain-containing protein, partial [Puia sp.]